MNIGAAGEAAERRSVIVDERRAGDRMTHVDASPQELLEATGQTGPPVKLVPLIEALDCRWCFADVNLPRVEAAEPDLILVPRWRANDSKVRFGLAHDLRHAALRVPGGFEDLAVPHLREREESFDRWARSLLLPVHWFRSDALLRLSVRKLADRYGVEAAEVIWRAIELELCHLICRDKESYRLYLAHPWWASTKQPLGRRLTYLTTHRYCEMLVEGRPCGSLAVAVHHLPSGYEWLGRERDKDLRSFCPVHHLVQHPHISGQPRLFEIEA
jgi:hypothetical protein